MRIGERRDCDVATNGLVNESIIRIRMDRPDRSAGRSLYREKRKAWFFIFLVERERFPAAIRRFV